jgi:uncharacterized protein (TIGR03435 family)
MMKPAKLPSARSWIYLAFLGCLAAQNCFGVAGGDGPKIGDVPPDLKISKMLQGPPASEVNWAALKGKVVVLEFWATWCGPCVQAIPHWNELAGEFKNRPVVFLSVSAENEGVVKSFLDNHPIKSWVGLDDYEVLNKAFAVKGIPHTVILGADGRIAAITHPASLQPQHLEEILAGKKSSLPPLPTYVSPDELPASEVDSSRPPAWFEVSIRERKVPQPMIGAFGMMSTNEFGYEGKICPITFAIGFVFDKPACCTLLKCKMPPGYYDIVLRAPAGEKPGLRRDFIAALRAAFNLEVTLTNREMEAWVLTQISTNAPGFHPATARGGGGQTGGGFHFTGATMKTVVQFLERALDKPVFDETKLDGRFDVDMKWELSDAEKLQLEMDPRVQAAMDANPDGDWLSALSTEVQHAERTARLLAELAKPEAEQFLPDPAQVVKAAHDRLGLQLTPLRRQVEIVEVRKTGEVSE